MKRRLLLALGVGFFLSFGTIFFEESQDGATGACVNDPAAGICILDRIEQRGFPFEFIEQTVIIDSTSSVFDAPLDREFNLIALIANWLSWSAIVFIGLLLVEWLTGFVGKLIVKVFVGAAAVAYMLLLVVG